jgi:hypothetical protein
MMIDATVAPKGGLISPFGTTVCNVNHISARNRGLSRPPSADYQGLRRPTRPRQPDQSLRTHGDGRGCRHSRAGTGVGHLSGRSPLYRLEEFFTAQDTELLLGKAVPPHALNDDTVGHALDRLYDFGTMRLFTACAVRAATRFGLERCYVHFDTTSRSVWGDYQYTEE